MPVGSERSARGVASMVSGPNDPETAFRESPPTCATLNDSEWQWHFSTTSLCHDEQINATRTCCLGREW